MIPTAVGAVEIMKGGDGSFFDCRDSSKSLNNLFLAPQHNAKGLIIEAFSLMALKSTRIFLNILIVEFAIFDYTRWMKMMFL